MFQNFKKIRKLEWYLLTKKITSENPSETACRLIRNYQLPCSSTRVQIVREVLEKIQTGMFFQTRAIMALQESAEFYAVELLEDSNLCAVHPRRDSIKMKCMQEKYVKDTCNLFQLDVIIF